MNLAGLVKEVEGCIQRQTSDRIASLFALSFDPSAAKSIRESDTAIESLCQITFSGAYVDVMTSLLKSRRLVQDQQYARAYDEHILGFIKFLDIFREETNWLVPWLHRLTIDCRLLAQRADTELSKARGVEVTQSLENAEQNLKKGFSLTVNDRAPVELSKKPATLYIVNQLFKIYFRLNKLNLCANVIQAVKRQNFEQFTQADQVTYKYYHGRILMYEDKYRDAEECFDFAWRHCNKSFRNNKRMILQFLVPVKMSLGIMPSPTLLREYQLDEYVELATAIRQGNLLAFDQSLVKYQDMFVHQGMYLLMHKLRPLVMRTLLKKVYVILNIHARKNQLKLTDFQTAVAAASGADAVDMDTLECILSNLIFKRYIRGYISHKHQILKLRDATPFPAMKDVVS